LKGAAQASPKQKYSPPNEMKPISPLGLMFLLDLYKKKVMGLKLREVLHII